MMMDKKSLLENGLLEQYLLGELNANQCNQIEQLLASDTELKGYCDTLEKDLERLGFENAIVPPAALKTQLLDQIKITKTKDSKVLSINNTNNTKFYLGIVASIAAVLVVGLFYMYSQMNDLNQQLQTVEADNTSLNSTIEVLNNKLETNETFYAAIANPDTEQYILKGNASLPEAKVVSYVNHKTKSIVVNVEGLPELDANHDYQMWADVEGEMINMGVISKNKNLIAMTYIDQAESLNITIEPSGGKEHPTVERLIGNVYLK